MSDFLQFFQGSGLRPWLPHVGRALLFTLKLKGVEDHLDPDSLWEHTYGGGGSIYETISKSSNRRLKDALDAHRKMSYTYEEGFEFPIDKMMVFSDVVIWLPQSIWNGSAREGGEDLFMLSEKLKYRHRSDFSEELLNQQTPHYSIMPHQQLDEDEIIFQFGLGVYLPRGGDVQTAEIKIIQAKGKPLSFPDWVFFEDQNRVTRAATIYEKQHHLLIGNNLMSSAIQSPSWFTQDKGYLVLDTSGAKDGSYADDAYISAGDVSTSGNATFCAFHTVDGVEPVEQIKLLIQRKQDDGGTDSSSVDAAYGDTVIMTNTDLDNDPLSGLTVISSNNEPVFLYYLSITGIVLPKIDFPNIKHWLLQLNQQGMPAATDEDIKWIIRGDNKTIEWCYAESQQWQDFPIEKEAPFPDTSPLTIRSPALEDSQFGILMLPEVFASPLSHNTITLGRENDNGMMLQLINRDDSLIWTDNTTHKLSMGHLGLSAHHLSLQIKGQNLSVQQQSKSAPTYILEDQIITQTLEADSFTEATLNSSHEIIVGNYLLQYTKELVHDVRA